MNQTPKPGNLKVVLLVISAVLLLVVIVQMNANPYSPPETPEMKATIRLNQELLCPKEQGGRTASNEEIKRCIDNLGDPYKK
jgi:hypothetical protein